MRRFQRLRSLHDVDREAVQLPGPTPRQLTQIVTDINGKDLLAALAARRNEARTQIDHGLPRSQRVERVCRRIAA